MASDDMRPDDVSRAQDLRHSADIDSEVFAAILANQAMMFVVTAWKLFRNVRDGGRRRLARERERLRCQHHDC